MIRLADAAQQYWAELDGYAASRNMPDLRTLPLGRFCNFVWWWLTKNAESEAEVTKVRSRLWRPPLGVAAPAGSPWSAEAETNALAGLQASMKR